MADDLEPAYDPFQAIAAAPADTGNPPRGPSAETPVSPVPLDALRPTFRHPSHGVPSATPWAYRDAEGRVLSYVVRFDKADGGKEVLPYTLWRNASGATKWKWKGAHGMRALYGLDRLAAQPEAPVLVVEGEKTADAAARRFPWLVALTWMGGAAAVGKADWSPLRGRQLAAWADADEAGSAAAASAVAAALEAGALAASLVTLPAYLPDKWDLADDWPADLTQQEAERLIRQALAASTSAVRWPPGYRMNADGFWFDKTMDGKVMPLHLSDPFEVVGEARDPDGGGWAIVIRFHDPDGRTKTQVIPKGSLASSPGEVRALLASDGLGVTVQRGLAERFVGGLAGLKAAQRLTLMSTTGWAGEGRFVLPHRTVGREGHEPVLFTGNPIALHYGAAGSFDAWRDQVARLASGNPMLMLALSIGFAGPLLRPLGLEGGGFHFRGPSSCGKTTLAAAAASIWAGGGPLGGCHTWRSTTNALEMIAVGTTETLLALDELALVAPEEAGQAAYSLASGQAKGRARQDGSLRPRPEWRVILLSTGEIALADHIRTSRRGDRAMAGQELRLLDISADVGAGLGVWEDLHGCPNPAEFSDGVRRASLQNYGHAGPAFLEALVQDRRTNVALAKEMMLAFLKDADRGGDTGQVHRGAHRFALVAAAGDLAAAHGIVPWAEGEAPRAVLEAFNRWAKGFGRGVVREEQTVLQVLRAALEMHQARFARLSQDDGPDHDWRAPSDDASARDARALNTLGYVHHHEGATYYLVHPSGWLEIFRGHDPAFAAKSLDAAGFLLAEGEGRLQRAKRVQGQVRRFYWVRASILAEEAH